MKKFLILIAVVGVILGGIWLYGTFAPTRAASGPTTPAPLANVPAALRKFQIHPGKTSAKFILSELLRGRPTEVVGSTRDVAGELAVSLADLGTLHVGEIKVNARTLKTDSDMRDRMMGNRILSTADFEFIKFNPSGIRGLGGNGTAGSKLPFTLTGDLTIRDVARPVAFAAVLEIVSPSELKVTASATVKRADYALVIPNVPGVANVSEEVRIEIEGVAVAVD